VSTPRLALAAVPALALLALDDGRLRLVLPVAALVALLVIGELWLRALTAEAVGAACRIGLVVAAALVTLPLTAITLHLLGVPIRGRSLAFALGAVVLLLGALVLLRERSGRVPADPRFARTVTAVLIPLLLALVVGGSATFAYGWLPHPPQPGFTSVALSGWAARIDRPVAIPVTGLVVPLQVSSAGEPAGTAPLVIQVGDRVGPARPVPLPVDGTSAIAVRVPAPPDGCLHRIEISLGPASTVFYARGPVGPRRAVTAC
jgi:hypothetical protein